MIHFRSKKKAPKKTIKSDKRITDRSKAPLKEGLTAAEVAEINLFSEVIARMNVRADERRRGAKPKS